MNSQESTVQKVIAKVHPSRKTEAKALNSGLEKRLFSYALAAGAGLSLTSAAKAEIVYTPVFHKIRYSGLIPIDLDNDGLRDFVLTESSYGGMAVYPTGANKIIPIRFRHYGTFIDAAPLKSGAFIGAGAQFFAGANVMAYSYFCEFQTGPWAHTVGRYLGLAFQKDGKAHFGWARVNVDACGMALTGYAYETIPGKSILAGQTNASADRGSLRPGNLTPTTPTAQPATLGLLAQGATGLVAWRREEEQGFGVKERS